MPTYDYRCEKGHVFELFHSMKDEEPKHCPKCGTLAKRVPGGGSGFLFKGSGFYITDYRSKSYKEGAKGDKGDKGDKGGSGGGGDGGSGGGGGGSGGSGSGGGSGSAGGGNSGGGSGGGSSSGGSGA